MSPILSWEKRKFAHKCNHFQSQFISSITMNGLYENVNKRSGIAAEIDELIPGSISGNIDGSDEIDDDSLLPKLQR